MYVPHFVLPVRAARRGLVALFSLLLFSVVHIPVPILGQEAPITIGFGPVVEVIQGAPANLTLYVSSRVTLINVTVSSTCDVGPTRTEGDANRNLILEPGERWQYRCEISLPTQSFNQFATVIAQKQHDQAPVSASTATKVIVLNIGIDLAKQLALTAEPILQGQTVTFTLTLRNTGSAAIAQSAIALSDPMCANGLQLQPMAGVTDDQELDADPDGDLSNGVNGEQWHYLCIVPAVIDDFTNIAQVQVIDRLGRHFSHRAQAAVTVLNPGLAIVQSVATPIVNAGAPITWTTQIFNVGEIAFRDVAITASDAGCPPLGPLTPGPRQPPLDGDSNNNGLWEPGEIWRFQCSHAYAPSVTEPARIEHNTATVTAIGVPGGATYGPQSASAAVQVFTQRGVRVVQVLPAPPILRGQAISLPLTVTNSGSVELGQVHVNAPYCTSGPTLVAGDADTNGNLRPDDPATPIFDGEAWQYACTVANVQQSFTHSVRVTAQDSAGRAITPVYTNLTVPVANPGLTIRKSISETTVFQGDQATFALQVTNNGSSELDAITVTDPQCDYGVVVGPFFLPDAPNDGDARLDPGENWHYQCTTAHVQRDFVNTALVTARDPFSTVLQTGATTPVIVQAPALLLQQSPPFQIVAAGEPVTFTVAVINRGTVPLQPVDDRPVQGLYAGGIYAPLCTRLLNLPEEQTLGLLSPGEQWRYHCIVDGAVTRGRHELVNFVAVAFHNDAGDLIYDERNAIAQLLPATVHLEKTADPVLVTPGSAVTLHYSVRNHSDQPLTGVTLHDPDCPTPSPLLPNSDLDQDTQLDSTEQWGYTCIMPEVWADLRNNVATVTATDAGGAAVQDQDDAPVTVLTPTITLRQEAQTPLVQEGQPARFTLFADNHYLVNLLDPQVDAPQCQSNPPPLVGGDLNGDGKLSPTEHWRYDCIVATTAGVVTNTVTMTGQLEYNITIITRTATSTVEVLGPAVELTQSPRVQAVTAGRSVTFTVAVRNASASDLADVQVNASHCSTGPSYSAGDDNADERLNPGESWSYSCIIEAVQVDLTNTAMVTVQTNAGTMLQAIDNARVVIRQPAIGLRHSIPTAPLTVGQTAAFTFTVENLGNQVLNDVQLAAPACTTGPAQYSGDSNGDNRLALAEQWLYACTVTNIQPNFVVTATVTARDPDATLVQVGTIITASIAITTPLPSVTSTAPLDTVTPVTLTVPSITDPPLPVDGTPTQPNETTSATITLLTPQAITVTPGFTVTLPITVINSGSVALYNLVVTYDLCTPSTLSQVSDNTDTNGILDVGERWHYHCSLMIEPTTAAVINGRIRVTAGNAAGVHIEAVAMPLVAIRGAVQRVPQRSLLPIILQ